MKLDIHHRIDFDGGKTSLDSTQLEEWFLSNYFSVASFEDGRFIIQGGRKSPSFLIKENPPLTTYWRYSKWGAVIVFEVLLTSDCLIYNCYCPIWLFEIFALKWAFRSSVPWITGYRREGFELHEEFHTFVMQYITN